MGKSEQILMSRSTRFVFYKSIAKTQKTLQKVLTNSKGFDIIYERLAGDRERRARLNLENDTERRNAKRQMILMSEDLQREREIGRRIKRKSLILAQDERWRRA